MEFYILNRNEEVVSILSNEGESNFLSSAVMKEELNSMNTLDLEVSTLAPEVANLREENFVLFQDISEEWHVFTIKEISEIHGAESLKTVYCEDASQELLDYLIQEEFLGNSGTAQAFLGRALTGTRWSIGTVDVVSTGAFPSEVKYKSVLEGIHEIRKHWNLQVRFRFQIAGNKIVKRYIDMKKNVGANIGKRFEYTKDIVQVERTVQSTDLKTAIIPIGGVLKTEGQSEEDIPPIDITGVAWATPTNPVNKPLGQNYLEIPEATAQWGYKGSNGKMNPRFFYYENTELTNPNELIADAYKVLERVSKPITNYKLNVIDLFALTADYELSFESVNVGDIVSVIDHEFNPPIQLRTSVVRKELDLLIPENTSIELGSFIRNLVDAEQSDKFQDMIDNSISSSLENLQDSIQDLSGAFDKFKKDYSADEIGFNWVRNSDFKNNLKYWYGEGSVSLVSASGISYFDQVAEVTGGSSLSQSIEAPDSKKLFENNVTVSAFVKGSGKFVVELFFKDEKTSPHVAKFESKTLNSNDWTRYAFSTALRKNFTGKTYMETVTVKFISASGITSHVAGMMLNLGEVAGKYLLHNNDKIGNGVYDQIKNISNTEFANGNGYVYLEETDGLWVYDKPSDQRPMKMTALKGGMLGIGKWNLQTQKWDITTFIDGNMVNASCINTGTLNADLVRTGMLASKDGSVQINMDSGRFTIGGKGNTAEICNDYMKVKHSDGSYSQMSAEGFLHYNGSSKNMYHHLLYAGEYTCLSEQVVRINLPAEFKGKPFKVVTSVKRVNTYYDVFTYQAPLISFYAHADTLNTTEGWIEIYASVRAWDKDNFAEGILVGDQPTDNHWIKPTVAYWVFV